MQQDELVPEKKSPLLTDVTIDTNGFAHNQSVSTLQTNTSAISLIGKVLGGRYQLTQLLGEGGMSAVFLSHHKELDQKVAIKILRYDRLMGEENHKRFLQEAKATYHLLHPNLIRLLDFSAADGELPFLVMEFVSGTTLSEAMDNKRRFEVEEFVNLFGQVCDGLAYAHSKGIVHRDLKPSNIMLAKQPDGSELVKIVDFGIAKMAQLENQQVTKTGEIFGSPLYMSPEQCKSLNPDHRSDLYSLGCTMYECLSGDVPFQGQTAMQTIFMHIENPVPPMIFPEYKSFDTARSLSAVISKLLQKEPAERFQNAAEVKEALLACLTKKKIEPPAPQIPPRANKVSKPVAAALVLAATTALIVFANQALNANKSAPKSIPIITGNDSEHNKEGTADGAAKVSPDGSQKKKQAAYNAEESALIAKQSAAEKEAAQARKEIAQANKEVAEAKKARVIADEEVAAAKKQIKADSVEVSKDIVEAKKIALAERKSMIRDKPAPKLISQLSQKIPYVAAASLSPANRLPGHIAVINSLTKPPTQSSTTSSSTSSNTSSSPKPNFKQNLSSTPNLNQKQTAQSNPNADASPRKIQSLIDASSTKKKEGDLPGAEAIFAQALKLTDGMKNKKQPIVRSVYFLRLALLSARPDEGKDWANFALAANKVEELIPLKPSMKPLSEAQTYGWHGHALMHMNRFPEAYRYYQKATQVAASAGSDGDDRWANWISWQARALAKQNQLPNAIRLCDESISSAESVGRKPAALFDLLLTKASMLWDAKLEHEARKTLRHAQKVGFDAGLDPTGVEWKNFNSIATKIGMERRLTQ